MNDRFHSNYRGASRAIGHRRGHLMMRPTETLRCLPTDIRRIRFRSSASSCCAATTRSSGIGTRACATSRLHRDGRRQFGRPPSGSNPTGRRRPKSDCCLQRERSFADPANRYQNGRAITTFPTAGNYRDAGPRAETQFSLGPQRPGRHAFSARFRLTMLIHGNPPSSRPQASTPLVDCRSTIRKPTSTTRCSIVCPRQRSTMSRAASRPMAAPSTCTVVNDGSMWAAKSASPKPQTARSSGTRIPRACASTSTPCANWSELQ